MDAIEQLKQDVRDGRIDVNRLIDVIVMQARQLEAAKQRIEELEKKLGEPPRLRPRPRSMQPFSMRAEEKRQQARKPKPTNSSSRAKADAAGSPPRTSSSWPNAPRRCFPEGVPEQDCHLSHTRPVWRLEQGRAVVVAYEIYRGPKNQYGKIPGVLGPQRIRRGDRRRDRLLRVCHGSVLRQSLSDAAVLAKSDAGQDAGRRRCCKQLSRHWQHEFDVLCTLLANSMVVHADETSWSINSVWAFLSEKARVLFFGVHKDADTLEQILDPATFAGIVISDDAAVYANFQSGAKVLGSSAAQGDQADAAGARQLGVSPVHGSLVGDLSQACRVQQ